MKRLIDADDLKRALVTNGFRNDVDMMMTLETINNAPTIDAEPHWIPCSEKLPEIGQWVLCQCRAGIMDLLRFTADGSWDKDYPNTEYMSSFVIAWMPLPKPYEGVEND